MEERDQATGLQLVEHVVWLDPVSEYCPRCREGVGDVGSRCPVMIDGGSGAGGMILEWDRKHYCGEWIDVALWTTGDEEKVPLLMGRARDRQKSMVEHEAKQIAKRLRADLLTKLTYLHEPLGEDLTPEEVAAERDDRALRISTGSDSEPDVYHYGTRWIAWDNGPRNEGDLIEVIEEDLTVTMKANARGAQ